MWQLRNMTCFQILHLSGGQKFDHGSKAESYSSYIAALHMLRSSSGSEATTALCILLRQLEFVQRHLIWTGCYETAILNDSWLSSILWISSILYLAHAAISYLFEKSACSHPTFITSHSSLTISLWFFFIHLNLKQPSQSWRYCPSCRLR